MESGDVEAGESAELESALGAFTSDDGIGDMITGALAAAALPTRSRSFDVCEPAPRSASRLTQAMVQSRSSDDRMLIRLACEQRRNDFDA